MLLPLLLSLAIQTPPQPGAERTTERIVVTPLAAQRNVDAGLVAVLGDVMLSELSSRGFTVVGYSDIQAMLDNEAARSVLACDGTNCLAELGDAMGARYLIHSSLGKVGDQYVLNLKLIDVEGAAVKHRVTRQVAGVDEAALIEGVRQAVVELMVPLGAGPALVAASTGSVVPLALAVSGSVVALAGAGVGIGFGVLSVGELKFAPVDPRYASSVQRANDNALISTIGWATAGVGAAVAAGGLTLMVLEE